MADTNTNTVTVTLAARAAGLLSKSAGLAIVEKALDQAIAARRVFPPLAADFGEQIGYELPLKTKDFVQVVGRLLASSDKPLKGVISRRKSEVLGVLAELVGALTDTPAIALPSWAVPKERAKKEAEAVDASGALDRANAEALALKAAEAAEAAEAVKVEAKSDTALAKAVALIVASAADLTEEQRAMLAQALALSEPALM